MDVRPVGAGPSGTDLAHLAGPSGPAAKLDAVTRAGGPAFTAPIDAAALAAIVESDLSRLFAILEPPLPSDIAARYGETLQAAITAAAGRDVESALSAATQLVSLHPLRAEALREEPGLEPVRAELHAFLARVAQVARLDAEGRIAQASELVHAAGLKELAGWETRPEILLMLAHSLLDTGGHTNFVRAAEVAQAVIDATHWAPAVAPLGTVPPSPAHSRGALGASRFTRERGSARTSIRIRALWRRAPLLVLLLAWFAVGLIGGVSSLVLRRLWPDAPFSSAFDLWALGFLGLVLFGFYMRVRNVRL